MVFNTDIYSDNIIITIRNKWHKNTKDTNGYFMRHIDGDKSNINLNNLQWIHPKTAMENIEWCCDWIIGLTKQEIDFVKNNSNIFSDLYS